MNIASDEKGAKKNADLANAYLKLGLLHYQQGAVHKSVEFLQSHFENARTGDGENTNQTLIDRARVNLGIAEANT